MVLNPKIFVTPWSQYINRNKHLEYHLLNCIRDQHELSYDIWSRPEWIKFVLDAYGHSFWVTIDPNLPSPLPAWAHALVFLEAPGRFARLSLGHESYQAARGPADIRQRAVKEFLIRKDLVNVCPRGSPLWNRNQTFFLEITLWIEYFAYPFPEGLKPAGIERIASILHPL